MLLLQTYPGLRAIAGWQTFSRAASHEIDLGMFYACRAVRTPIARIALAPTTTCSILNNRPQKPGARGCSDHCPLVPTPPSSPKRSLQPSIHTPLRRPGRQHFPFGPLARPSPSRSPRHAQGSGSHCVTHDTTTSSISDGFRCSPESLLGAVTHQPSFAPPAVTQLIPWARCAWHQTLWPTPRDRLSLPGDPSRSDPGAVLAVLVLAVPSCFAARA